MKVFSKKSKTKAAPKPKKYSKFEIVLDRQQLTTIKDCLQNCLNTGMTRNYQFEVAEKLFESFNVALKKKL